MKLLHEIMFVSGMLFMPDYPTPRPASHNYTRNVSIGFVDWKGTKRNMNISGIDPTVTGGEVDALRASAGAISNAGVYRDALEDETEMDVTDAISHIDPFAEVSDVGVFKFKHPNNLYEDITVELPAIWGNKVVPGGKVINSEDGEVSTFIADCLAVLNKVQIGGADWYFAGAFYSDRKGDATVKSERPTSKDPRNTGV